MVRDLDSNTRLAIRSRSALIIRDFVTITAKDDDDNPVVFGFWNDSGTINANVIDGQSGLVVQREFTGDGALLKMDTIPLKADMSVRTVQFKLSLIHPLVREMHLGHNLRFAPVEIHRGHLDLNTHDLVSAARPRMVGKIDGAPKDVPAIGGKGSITIRVVSHTREATRTNTAKRSDETHRLRSGDRFRADAGVVGDWSIFWGENEGTA